MAADTIRAVRAVAADTIRTVRAVAAATIRADEEAAVEVTIKEAALAAVVVVTVKEAALAAGGTGMMHLPRRPALGGQAEQVETGTVQEDMHGKARLRKASPKRKLRSLLQAVRLHTNWCLN